MDITLILTQEKANVLLTLIDLAVKSGGLNVAEAGVVLARDIREAAKVAQQAPQVPLAVPPIPDNTEAANGRDMH